MLANTTMTRAFTWVYLISSLLPNAHRYAMALEEPCEFEIQVDVYFCARTIPDVMEQIMTEAGECTLGELESYHVSRRRLRRRLGRKCNACQRGRSNMACMVCPSMRRGRKLHRNTPQKELVQQQSGEDDKPHRDLTSTDFYEMWAFIARAYHAPIDMRDWVRKNGRHLRPLSENCRPKYHDEIADACIDKLVVTYPDSCKFKAPEVVRLELVDTSSNEVLMNITESGSSHTITRHTNRSLQAIIGGITYSVTFEYEQNGKKGRRVERSSPYFLNSNTPDTLYAHPSQLFDEVGSFTLKVIPYRGRSTFEVKINVEGVVPAAAGGTAPQRSRSNAGDDDDDDD